ncbi:hypothetical protein LZ30DRAFT_44029 [Colletotrichum cereale]|nr:hypothetical protein LZ30DRAFT_44029 [Colletotrichum cereale]
MRPDLVAYLVQSCSWSSSGLKTLLLGNPTSAFSETFVQPQTVPVSPTCRCPPCGMLTHIVRCMSPPCVKECPGTGSAQFLSQMPFGNATDDNSLVAIVTACIHMPTTMTSDPTSSRWDFFVRAMRSFQTLSIVTRAKYAFPFYVEMSRIYPCSLCLFFCLLSPPSRLCKLSSDPSRMADQV